ncbi:MAG TPA: 50S ribosomal protein L25/general stress protein Ctc [Bacteroidetes bacterium]|nr:50S ribosomal protein L25/general stress protein Ctc [Bacteroidota bacterium]
MEKLEIKTSKRKETGKKASKQLRKEGYVPCVLYGGKENIHFAAEEKTFRKLIYTPKAFLVDLFIDNEEHKAVLQDISFHPVTDHILHIDFKEVFDDKKVNIDIPIHIVGDSIGIKAGGNLAVKRRTLRVRALPKDLPDFLEVDITNLNIGQSLKVRDLHYDNLEILDPGQAMVVGVISSRLAKLSVEEIAAQEAAEEAASERAAESAEAAAGEEKKEAASE